MTQGKGFPSIWMSSNDDDLEKIALGILLGRDDLQKVQLIGFDPCCFDKTKINVIHAPNPEFPLPSVGYLHYELQIDTDIERLLYRRSYSIDPKNYSASSFPQSISIGIDLDDPYEIWELLSIDAVIFLEDI